MLDFRVAAALVSLSIVVAPSTGCGEPTEPELELPAALPMVNGARIAAADSEPGSWLTTGRTYSEQRFSPLREINAENVAQLGLAWSQALDSLRGVEATPIVADGRMYVTGDWSVISALDARSGELLWRYDPEVPRETGPNACCDVVNRGVALWKGAIYSGTIDGRLLSLDAASGALNWQVQTTDTGLPYSITGAPRIVKDLVIIGNGGGERLVRGYITAYRADSGEQAWRFYTVPGDPSQPFEHPELESAVKTWNGEWWKVGGGGTAWDAMAYDSELDLLYVGTGNGSPWTRTHRSPGGGDNLYLASILALRPETGELVWYSQPTPGDTWDYPAPQPIVLADLAIDGRTRKVLMQAPKNGFFYVLDRASGELLSADAYVPLNWATHVDLETGRPIETPAGDYKDEPKRIFPGPSGGHNWHPMSFSPSTGLVYIPARDMEAVYAEADPNVEQKLFWDLGLDVAESVVFGLGGGEVSEVNGFVIAWDPVAKKQVWRTEMASYFTAGMLATASDLLFSGGADGVFKAQDAQTGAELWSIETPTGIMAAPMSYELDGEQYIAVAAGWGGAAIAGARVPGSAVLKYRNEGRVFAFKLGASAAMPENEEQDLSLSEVPAVAASESELAQGSRLYHQNCFACHGAAAESALILPDLRYMKPAVHEAFQSIVRLGAYEGKGMPSFGELLSESDVELVHAYINSRAQLLHDAPSSAGEK